MIDQREYENGVSYLERYGNDDWVGFGVVSGIVGELLGAGASNNDQRALAVQIVADLYDRGIVPGDLTSSDTTPFMPWGGTKGEVMSRVKEALEADSELPDTGDVCWFSAAESA